MSDPTVTISALDRDLLARAAAVPDRARLAAELPALRRPAAELADELAATGLLGPLDALYAVRVGASTVLAEAWAPDRPAVPTTLRVGLAALDPDAEAEAAALAAVVGHLLRTTAVARVERAVFADDAAARAACERAGLAFESVRRQAALLDGRPADIALHARLRRPEPSQRPRLP
jgi:hypothetical protein